MPADRRVRYAAATRRESLPWRIFSSIRDFLFPALDDLSSPVSTQNISKEPRLGSNGETTSVQLHRISRSSSHFVPRSHESDSCRRAAYPLSSAAIRASGISQKNNSIRYAPYSTSAGVLNASARQFYHAPPRRPPHDTKTYSDEKSKELNTVTGFWPPVSSADQTSEKILTRLQERSPISTHPFAPDVPPVNTPSSMAQSRKRPHSPTESPSKSPAITLGRATAKRRELLKLGSAITTFGESEVEDKNNNSPISSSPINSSSAAESPSICMMPPRSLLSTKGISIGGSEKPLVTRRFSTQMLLRKPILCDAETQCEETSESLPTSTHLKKAHHIQSPLTPLDNFKIESSPAQLCTSPSRQVHAKFHFEKSPSRIISPSGLEKGFINQKSTNLKSQGFSEKQHNNTLLPEVSEQKLKNTLFSGDQIVNSMSKHINFSGMKTPPKSENLVHLNFQKKLEPVLSFNFSSTAAPKATTNIGSEVFGVKENLMPKKSDESGFFNLEREKTNLSFPAFSTSFGTISKDNPSTNNIFSTKSFSESFALKDKESDVGFNSSFKNDMDSEKKVIEPINSTSSNKLISGIETQNLKGKIVPSFKFGTFSDMSNQNENQAAVVVTKNNDQIKNEILLTTDGIEKKSAPPPMFSFSLPSNTQIIGDKTDSSNSSTTSNKQFLNSETFSKTSGLIQPAAPIGFGASFGSTAGPICFNFGTDASAKVESGALFSKSTCGELSKQQNTSKVEVSFSREGKEKDLLSGIASDQLVKVQTINTFPTKKKLFGQTNNTQLTNELGECDNESKFSVGTSFKFDLPGSRTDCEPSKITMFNGFKSNISSTDLITKTENSELNSNIFSVPKRPHESATIEEDGQVERMDGTPTKRAYNSTSEFHTPWRRSLDFYDTKIQSAATLEIKPTLELSSGPPPFSFGGSMAGINVFLSGTPASSQQQNNSMIGNINNSCSTQNTPASFNFGITSKPTENPFTSAANILSENNVQVPFTFGAAVVRQSPLNVNGDTQINNNQMPTNPATSAQAFNFQNPFAPGTLMPPQFRFGTDNSSVGAGNMPFGGGVPTPGGSSGSGAGAIFADFHALMNTSSAQVPARRRKK